MTVTVQRALFFCLVVVNFADHRIVQGEKVVAVSLVDVV